MLLRWGLAGVLVLHGIGHAMFAFTAWTDTPMGFTESPWILPGGMTATSPVGQISALIWLAAMALFLLAAAGIVRSAGWWPKMALIAAVLSLAVLVLWWNTITPDSRMWALLVDIAIIGALAGSWRSKVIAAIG